MPKIIKQEGHDTVLDLEWAVDQSTEVYNTLFAYFDEMVNPHSTADRKMLSDNCKSLLNTFVKTLKIATLLSDEDVVLDSLFSNYDIDMSHVSVVEVDELPVKETKMIEFSDISQK